MSTNPKPETNPQSETSHAFYAPDPRPKWKRALGRIWPGRHHPLPELPFWAKDGVVADVTVGLSGLDRWRVLLSGRLSVRVVTFTQNAPGRSESTSVAQPLPPCFVTGERPTQTDTGKLPNPRHIAGIPVTELRDGDTIVVSVPGCLDAETGERIRSTIRERLLPTRLDVLVMVGNDRPALSHILRPAPRIEVKGTVSPHPTLADVDAAMGDIANTFLRWPLPKTVAADLCATDSTYPHGRSGTNLLNSDEAKAMVSEVVRPVVDALLAGRIVVPTEPDPALVAMLSNLEKDRGDKAAPLPPIVADAASQAHLPEAP